MAGLDEDGGASEDREAAYARLCELVARRESETHGRRRDRTRRDGLRLATARRAVLLRSDGRCEKPGCGRLAPDLDDQNRPLMEVDQSWASPTGAVTILSR
ncbi:hypothetical protein GCM10023195_87860 [Actinoallomurus liliacearum]|uniref:DUF222 domain-containing protein n=1 Tax=Actinoallomurus liliacearum TaxID=1080073 RepID=A0ABP8U0G6_9ACTN